jgi:hypothetical protein
MVNGGCHRSRRRGGGLALGSFVLLCMWLVGCGGTAQQLRPVRSRQARCVLVPYSAMVTLGESGAAHATRNGMRVTRVQAVSGAFPTPLLTPPSAPPLEVLVGEGLGDGVPRGVLRLVPWGGAAPGMEASAATGELAAMGGAVAAAAGSGLLLCLTIRAAAAGEPTPIDIADEYYGTRFGDLVGWVQGRYPPQSFSIQPAPLPGSSPTASPTPEPGRDDEKRRRWGRVYVTYTRFNNKTRLYYSGRTSMVVDLDQPRFFQAAWAILVRDRNHHLDEMIEPDEELFDDAVMDEFDTGNAVDYNQRYSDLAYWRIRGREQQLIDSHGGARSDTGEPYRTENVVRGVAKDNEFGRRFHDAANEAWGALHPYTGY